MTDMHTAEPHYSETHRWSYIWNALILNESWNDKEEIAFQAHQIATLTSQVEALEAQLLTARNDALDEAASVARDNKLAGWTELENYGKEWFEANRNTCEAIESKILSLKG